MSNTLPIALTRLLQHISNHLFSLDKFDPYDHFAACWVTLSESVIPLRTIKCKGSKMRIMGMRVDNPMGQG